MDRILVVEDEAKTAEILQRGLQLAGYSVDVANTGEDALHRMAATQYDTLVLDVMLPGISGLEVVRRVRQGRWNVSVLALTAQGGLDERVEGLDAGCDDYLPKPFAFEELLARMRALRRRAEVGQCRELSYRELTLDLISRIAVRDGREVRLTNTEYALLEALMRFPEQPVDRRTLHERIWGGREESPSNLLDVFVNHLRRKIDGPCERKLVHTVRGVGYLLSDKG